MEKIKKLAIFTVCLFCLALFSSACGGDKPTPPDYSYLYLLNQEEENEAFVIANTELNLTLTESLQTDKIASADIYYSIEDNQKSSAEDQEILKAEPNANDKTKFKISIIGEPTNAKIKAVLTYDSEGNLLDYFSSYDGIKATNNNFIVNFGNRNDNAQGFGGGNGTSNDPYIISAPRHFVNINKQDNQGKYLYMDKCFKQTANIDFSHLTGLKIIPADEDKDITIETVNEKAPFYNEGEGITPIGKIEVITEDTSKHAFKGSYDGDNNIIDGIMIVNPANMFAKGLFGVVVNGTVKNVTVGENSILFMDKLTSHICRLGLIVGYGIDSQIEKCENRGKFLWNNIETDFEEYTGFSIYIGGIVGHCESYVSNFNVNNCTNKGNITINNCQFKDNSYCELYIQPISNAVLAGTNNINEGNINITNNKFIYSVLQIFTLENEYTNNGNITIDNNTNFLYILAYDLFNQNDLEISNCTNNGDITITNNKLENANYHTISAFNINANDISNCTNNGNILIENNSEEYDINVDNIYSATGNVVNCENNGTITVN